MNAITINKLQYNINPNPVLSLPDFQFSQGQHTLISGSSGSGKSTLLHLLTGLLKPSSGTISVLDQDISRFSCSEMDRFRSTHFGIIYQRIHLAAQFTINRNLSLPFIFSGLQMNQEKIDSLLSSLGILEKKNDFPHQLSFGESQRVAIARAFLLNPEIIIADEPTSALDDQNCSQVADLLLKYAENNNCTLLAASHDERLKSYFSNKLELGR